MQYDVQPFDDDREMIMGQIVFNCPICSADLQVSDDLKGGLAQCYSCESTVMVPMAGVWEGMELGDFKIKRLLGKGGMGEVWLARQESADRDVAVKIPSPALTASPESIAAFMKEIETLSKLDHPNLVSIIDYGAKDGIYYLATDYIEGETIKSRLEREGQVPEQGALKIAKQVAEALDHAWTSFKLIHSDLNPSNIMISTGGSVKVLDLGISRSAASDSHLTQTGMIVGSPYYMSPEQANVEPDIDCRSDIYSVGATLYHMVTGKYPFEGPSALKIITKHVTDPLVPPKDVAPHVSEACSELICLFMSKQRESRPQNWRDTVKAIDLALAGQPPKVKLSLPEDRIFENTSFQTINLRQLQQSLPKAAKKTDTGDSAAKKAPPSAKPEPPSAKKPTGKSGKGAPPPSKPSAPAPVKSKSGGGGKKRKPKPKAKRKSKAKSSSTIQSNQTKSNTSLIIAIILVVLALIVSGVIVTVRVMNKHQRKAEEEKRRLLQKLEDAKKESQTATEAGAAPSAATPKSQPTQPLRIPSPPTQGAAPQAPAGPKPSEIWSAGVAEATRLVKYKDDVAKALDVYQNLKVKLAGTPFERMADTKIVQLTQTYAKKAKDLENITIAMEENKERVNTILGAVGKALPTIGAKIASARAATGRNVNCAPTAVDGAVTPSQLADEIGDGVLVTFKPGRYSRKMELAVSGSIVVQGSKGAVISDLRFFGDGEVTIRNLNCEKLDLACKSVVADSKIASFNVKTGDSVIGNSLLGRLSFSGNPARTYVLNSTLYPFGERTKEGLVVCVGKANLLMFYSVVCGGDVEAFDLSNNFSGQLVLDRCLVHADRSLGVERETVYGESNVTKRYPNWKSMLQRANVTFSSCVEDKPKFVNEGALNLTLSAASPAKDLVNGGAPGARLSDGGWPVLH